MAGLKKNNILQRSMGLNALIQAFKVPCQFRVTVGGRYDFEDLEVRRKQGQVVQSREEHFKKMSIHLDAESFETSARFCECVCFEEAAFRYVYESF